VVAEPYVLSASRAVDYNRELSGDPEENAVLQQIADRKYQVEPQQAAFAALCDRWDNLYYPETVLDHAGASHWASHPSATTPGRAHVSVNAPPVFVDIPASLQSVPPIENMVATVADEQGRQLAAMAERLYFAWKDEEQWELKGHKACVTKALYGITAGKVYWDPEKNRPCVTIVDQPRNLYLGWRTSDYKDLNWALYCYRQTAEGVYEEWGLEVDAEKDGDGTVIPYVIPIERSQQTGGITTTRAFAGQPMEVEVYDYWYRRPTKTKRRGNAYGGVKMETWNAIFVGNVCVKMERHPEYDGRIPYVPLFNTYIPGVPMGRPELFDIESLLLEKDERLTAGAQMLGKTVDGQYWQLVGPESPDTVPNGVMPKPNKVVAPGAGNRIEAITPWMPNFQLEQYLARIDREISDVSGLNELLRGLAPASVMSSSKAITALVANYEARVRIKRDLYYEWRQNIWELASVIWARKNRVLAPVLSGVAHLLATAPNLTPRDDMETAAMASNLVNSKLWSLSRGMDRVGVDDPESEEDIIRTESTDASLFPERVQTMTQLIAVLQSLGQQQAAMAAAGQAPGGVNPEQGLAATRAAMGGQQGVPMLNAPEEQPVAPPPEVQPANVTGPEALSSQTMVQGGEASGRILSQTEVPLNG
jgi:hypothetical protein